MEKIEKKRFNSISTLCFNADGTLVALSKGTREIFIYKTNGSQDPNKWERTHTLKEVIGPHLMVRSDSISIAHSQSE